MTEDEFTQLESVLLEQMEKNRAFSGRVWSPDYVRVWIAGELALSELTGITPNFTNKFNGDGGVDSYINIMTEKGIRKFTINIKTSKKPYNLIAEEKRNKADIYILAQYFPETKRANLLGWEFGKNIYEGETIQIKIPSGYKEFKGLPLHKLRDIQVLKNKMVKQS